MHATVRITVDRDDRRTRSLVRVLEEAVGDVEVRDARVDPEAAAFLERLVCCGPVAPVVECAGLVLTSPSGAEALAAIRRAAPELLERGRDRRFLRR